MNPSDHVFEIIRHKRQRHTPSHPEARELGFRGWHSRGYLPHFDMPGTIQMLNYRLHDAMPADRRHEWAALLKVDDHLLQRAKVESYLDRGLGNCELRNPLAAAIVEENWLFRDGTDYQLLAWAVMPNHVHLLVEIGRTPMTNLVRGWKGFTARKINAALGRKGKLWQDDYWDRYIRDEAHYRKVVHYIESNPVKAGLVRSPEQWAFSSARFRDQYNRLSVPDDQKPSPLK